MVKRAFRSVLLAGVALTLVHCADDAKKVSSTDDDGGAANGGEAPSSGGSGDVGETTAGAPATHGGMPGSAGEQNVEAGSGGAPTSGAPNAGAPNAGGAAGEMGMAGGGSCVPSDCCSGDLPSCASAWDTECSTGASLACCDPLTGISKSCGYGGGGVDRYAGVCINDCTGKSSGTSACGSCTVPEDPGCDTDWQAACGAVKVYCSDSAAGYRLSCVDVDQYSRTIDVECTCDPDAVISG